MAGVSLLLTEGGLRSISWPQDANEKTKHYSGDKSQMRSRHMQTRKWSGTLDTSGITQGLDCRGLFQFPVSTYSTSWKEIAPNMYQFRKVNQSHRLVLTYRQLERFPMLAIRLMRRVLATIDRDIYSYNLPDVQRLSCGTRSAFVGRARTCCRASYLAACRWPALRSESRTL